jgi:small subunit ribosomal protein S8
MTDPIADMLIRIKNGYLARHREVTLPHSRLKEELAKVLVKNDFLKDLKIESGETKAQKKIILRLKYRAKEPGMENIKRISKPGLRVYVNTSQLKRMIPELGITILSTNQGLLTLEEAKKANHGGEIICKVW